MSKSVAAEYQSQPWIMEPGALKAFAERISALPESAALFAIEVAVKPKELLIVDGIARIPIRGYLLETVPGWLRAWGVVATGYDEIASQVRSAASRKDVTAIELDVDSPGGMVAGVISAADAIYQARSAKPVTATITNLGASGAYWLTSQAKSIRAADVNTTAGSIGVYTYYIDFTGAEEKAGVKFIVVRSGEHKAMGMDTITDRQIAAVQEYIDATAENFIEAVARGRGRDADQVRELATGQLWIAATARELGLIDAVAESINQSSQDSDIKGDSPMKPEEEKTQEAASAEQLQEASRAAAENERIRMSQLKTEFADDPEFAMQAFTDGLTVAEARAKYCDVLRERLKEKDNSQSSIVNSQSQGASAIVTEDTDTGAGGDFLAEARAMAAEKKVSVTAAMQKLRRQKPALHAAFLEQCESRGKEMYAEAV